MLLTSIFPPLLCQFFFSLNLNVAFISSASCTLKSSDKLQMIAKSKSRHWNDKINETTAVTSGHYLILYSYELKWPFAGHDHVQRFLLLSEFSIFFFLPSVISQQGDVSNEGQTWPKQQDDYHQLYSHLSDCLLICLLLFLFPLPVHCFSLCHPFSHLLISDSTFHQLLVSSNSCHVKMQRARRHFFSHLANVTH